MQPPVWISIVCTIIETYVFVWDLKVYADQVSACYGRPLPCGYFEINCSGELRIQIDRLQYGSYCVSRAHCRNFPNTCPVQANCCAYYSNDCFQDLSENHTQWVNNLCLGRPSCGQIQAVWTTIPQSKTCSGETTTDYVIVNYTCVRGTDATVQMSSTTNGPTGLPSGTTSTLSTSSYTSSGNNLSLSGKYENGNSSPTIIGVVVAAIIVIAVVVVALIIFKRRQKKRTEDDTHISDLPKGLTNHMCESSKEAGESNAVAETSNYDSINDDSVLTYSRPVEKKKDTSAIPESANKYGDISAGEYDRIEFEMKGAIKASNYENLAAVEGKIGDDTYSHVSNQSKSVTTSRAIANEYSHCMLNSKDTLRNDDDYSHVDLHGDSKKHQQQNTNEEDSYNHIDFDDTKHPMRNGKTVIGENESESEKNFPTCTDVKSHDVESENYTLKNGDTGVSSKDAHHQGIKAVSLRDNNTELAPRSKDQQYTAVVKVQKGKQSDGIDGVAKENLDLKRPNVLLNTLSNSDYELAKPLDL